MDPVSAAIAIVGFAGGIAALAGVVVDSCRTLSSMWHLLKDAPQDTQRLFKKLQRFEIIILEVRRVGEELCNDPTNIESQQSWLGNVEDMLSDFNILKEKIVRLEGNLSVKPLSRKRICGTIQRIFTYEDIMKYDQILSGHTDHFTTMLVLASQNRANTILAETRTQSKVLSKLLASANSLETSLLQNPSKSSTKNLHQLVEDELRSLCLDGCDKQQQGALSFIRNTFLNGKSLRLQMQPSQERTPLLHDPLHLSSGCPQGKNRQNESDLNDQREKESQKPFTVNQDYDTLSRPLRRKNFLGVKKNVLGHLSVHHFPIGDVAIAVTQYSTLDSTMKKRQDRWSYSFDVCIYPPSWIASKAITLSLSASGTNGNAPSINLSLKQSYYNNNLSLAMHLQNANITGLQQMFAEGEARPTDQLAPWGNSLLHMSIIMYASGLVQSLDLCKFLLEQGADPNVRSSNGSTPLLLCCSLMQETSNLECGLRSLASLLINAGADLAVYNTKGFAPCSIVFNSHGGLSYLQSFVYEHVDLYTLQEMTSVDAWILAALARSFPTFQKCMERHIASYRTHKSLCSSHTQKDESIPQFNTEHQVAEVRQATVKVRTAFLRALCSKGTVPMIEPFLNGSIDLNEFEGPLPTTYMRAAASQGNTDMVLALMNAGASVNVEASYPEYGEWDPPTYRALSPVDDFFERWYSLREKRTQFTGSPSQEYWILKKMLRNPTFQEPNVLFWALWTSSPMCIIKVLLDAGCGRRDSIPSASWCQKVNGSEVIEAVKFQNQLVPLFLEYGLSKECEDCFGFTALLHALDGGKQTWENAKQLIDAGADLSRRTGSGFTPLTLVKRNVNIAHPRWPMASRTPRRRTSTQEIDKARFKRITLDEDRHSYDLVIKAMRERKTMQKMPWLQGLSALTRLVYALFKNLRERISTLHHRFRNEVLINLLFTTIGSLMIFFAFLLLVAWDLAWKRPITIITILIFSTLMLSLAPFDKMWLAGDRFLGLIR